MSKIKVGDTVEYRVGPSQAGIEFCKIWAPGSVASYAAGDTGYGIVVEHTSADEIGDTVDWWRVDCGPNSVSGGWFIDGELFASDVELPVHKCPVCESNVWESDAMAVAHEGVLYHDFCFSEVAA